MRAVRYTEFGGPEVLHVTDVTAPEAGPDELRVEVRAAAVNVFDLKKRSGMFGGDLPIVPGFDAAGVTADGRRVFGATTTGACAEVCVLHHWADMPDGLSFEEAASFVTLAEASVRSLELVGVSEGTTVAIAGARGAVGSTAVQIARARGAHVYETLDDVDHVDAGFDAAGRGDVPRLIELTGDPRKVVTIADFDAADLGVHVTSETSAWHALAEAAALWESGRFTVAVAQVVGFEDAARAHGIIEGGRERGKIVLAP